LRALAAAKRIEKESKAESKSVESAASASAGADGEVMDVEEAENDNPEDDANKMTDNTPEARIEVSIWVVAWLVDCGLRFD
jgi:hypothetical protein